MRRKIVIAGERRHLGGWNKDRPDLRDRELPIPKLKTFFLPRKVDLTSWCSKIEDQKDLGSCTANAATSCIEYIYKKAGKPQPELSRLFLYFATRVWIAQEEPNSDNGAMIRDVMKALAKYGTCIEGLWPYQRQKYFEVPELPAKTDASAHQITYYYHCQDLRRIKACLAEGFPAVGGFAVPESIYSRETEQSGIIAYPKPDEGFVGGHAVLFIGYDEDAKLLKFQNSWGVNWGMQGFGFLPYAYVEDYLADDFWTIRKAEL